MHKLYALKDRLTKELEEYADKGLSEASLKTIDTLAHAAKNLDKVIECGEAEGYSGYSRRMSYRDGASYDDGRHGSDRYYVRPDGSYARGRDAMGRYSRAGASLERLMESAPDERTKTEIRNIMNRL